MITSERSERAENFRILRFKPYNSSQWRIVGQVIGGRGRAIEQSDPSGKGSGSGSGSGIIIVGNSYISR